MIREKDVVGVYSKIKNSALNAFKRGDINKSISELSLSAQVMYMFNFFYTDDDSEELIAKISEKFFEPVYHGGSNQKKVIFYDSIATDNKGLTQQYLRALLELDYHILYISEKKLLKGGQSISNELMQKKHLVEIYELDENISEMEKMRELYKKLKDYEAHAALLHLNPWSVTALSVFKAFPQLIKFNINLTDHAFWLGVKIFDYNIEFRNYGYTLSIEKRGMNASQLLKLPYYPLVNEVNFDGFPIRKDSSEIFLFSGGAFYKIYGEKGIFFDIVKKILTENPHVTLFFAGGGETKPFKNFIKKNKFEKRIYLLGYRKDIGELFNHCDVYLGTYPLCGGLMSQYASHYGKPILAYSSPDLPFNFLEDFVSANEVVDITRKDLKSFFDYSNKVLQNSVFRTQEAQKLEKILITEEEFKNELDLIITSHISKRNSETIDINYNKVSSVYLEIENKFQHFFLLILLSRYKFSLFSLSTKVALHSFRVILNEYINKPGLLFSRFMNSSTKKISN